MSAAFAKSSFSEQFFRCPEGLLTLQCPRELNQRSSYFHFGSELLCYGPSMCHSPPPLVGRDLPDLFPDAIPDGLTLRVPFDASQIVDNFRLERYPEAVRAGTNVPLYSRALRQTYYLTRSALPDSLRRRLQRWYFRNWQGLPFPKWPVDTSVEEFTEKILVLSMKASGLDRIPFIWFWPDGALSSVIMTHDVETDAGVQFVPHLMDVDDSFNIKSSFQLVPEERYQVSSRLLECIRRRGCEVNVHGLNHNGNPFRTRKEFVNQAGQINRHIRDFGTDGFRSACMYRNLEWLDELDISYDMSAPNVAHLEPQRGGCCTVFPYFIGDILELPLTCIQDYSLFHILGEYSIELWKKQIELIMTKHGLISFIIHPDYIAPEKALSVYKELLGHISDLRSQKKVWVARPGEVNRWWRQRSMMTLVARDGQWRIEGQGSERAQIAFAHVKGEQIVYAVEERSIGTESLV
jgi:hypothetical protein